MVSKATIISDVYKEFYDLIVAISGFTNIVFPVFPANVLDAKADYPLVIINSPDISWDTFTFGKNILDGTIEIEVYTTTPKDTDVKASAINDKIELSKSTLAIAKLQMVTLDSTTKDMIPHGEIKVHIKTLTFKYRFTSVKSRAF